MIKRLLISIYFLLFLLTIYAQKESQTCGAEIPTDLWENEFQQLISEYKTNHQNQIKSDTIYTIPIIFHVIHSGQTIGTFPNISPVSYTHLTLPTKA